MKKLFFIFAMALATASIVAAGSGAGLLYPAQTTREAGMAYCTVADLRDAYGEDPGRAH